jgi:hypothetical protein
MVWPKLTVSDYSEMLRKLSTVAFLVTLASVSFLRSQVTAVDQFLGRFDVAPQIGVFSVPIPFGTLVLAGIVAVLTESTKLHDKISQLLGIRTVFDVRWILVPMALLSGATVDRNRFHRITADRKRLMNDVFYRYASSAKKAVIDSHLVVQALTAWSWYWICVESLVILTVTAAVFALFGKWSAATLVLAVMLVMLLLMRVFRAEASNYAEAEVSEILADNDRRQAVKSVLDAL